MSSVRLGSEDHKTLGNNAPTLDADKEKAFYDQIKMLTAKAKKCRTQKSDIRELKYVKLFKKAKKLITDCYSNVLDHETKHCIENADSAAEVIKILLNNGELLGKRGFSLMGTVDTLCHELFLCEKDLISAIPTRLFFTEWETNGRHLYEEELKITSSYAYCQRESVVAYDYFIIVHTRWLNYPYLSVIDIWDTKNDPQGKQIRSIKPPKPVDKEAYPRISTGLPGEQTIFYRLDEDEMGSAAYKLEMNQPQWEWKILPSIQKADPKNIMTATTEASLQMHEIRFDIDKIEDKRLIGVAKRLNEKYILVRNERSCRDTMDLKYIIYHCPSNQKFEHATSALCFKSLSYNLDVIVESLSDNRLIITRKMEDIFENERSVTSHDKKLIVCEIEEKALKFIKTLYIPKNTEEVIPIEGDKIVAFSRGGEKERRKRTLTKYDIKESKSKNMRQLDLYQEYSQEHMQIFRFPDKKAIILGMWLPGGYPRIAESFIVDLETFDYTRIVHSSLISPAGILPNNDTIIFRENTGKTFSLNLKEFYISLLIDWISQKDVATVVLEYAGRTLGSSFYLPRRPHTIVYSPQFFSSSELPRDSRKDEEIYERIEKGESVASIAPLTQAHNNCCLIA